MQCCDCDSGAGDAVLAVAALAAAATALAGSWADALLDAKQMHIPLPLLDHGLEVDSNKCS